MALFEVVYRESRDQQIHRVEVNGHSEELIRRDFEARHCRVLAIIRQAEGGVKEKLRNFLFGRLKINLRFGVNDNERALLCEVLKALYASGVPMLQAIQMTIEETPNPWLRKRLVIVLERLRDGADVYTAMSDPRCLKAFPLMMRETIRTGEASGRLDRSLDRLAEMFKRAAETRRDTVSAMIYPGLAFIVFLVVCTVIAIKVPDALVNAASEENLQKIWSQIPASIRLLFFLRENWWYLSTPFVLVGGMMLIWSVGMRYPASRLALTRVQRRVPIIGGILYQFALVRFLDLLSANHESGIQVTESLRLIRGSINDALIEDSLGRMGDRILVSGESLTEVISDEKNFTGLVIQMIRAGEESGRLTEVLNPITDYYRGQAKAMLKRALDLMTPAMVILLGSVIGPVVLGTYVTLTKLQELQITGFGG